MKVKPCPFCGSDDLYFEGNFGTIPITWEVACNTCRTFGPVRMSQDKITAIKRWNKRAKTIIKK